MDLVEWTHRGIILFGSLTILFNSMLYASKSKKIRFFIPFIFLAGFLSFELSAKMYDANRLFWTIHPIISFGLLIWIYVVLRGANASF